MPERPLLVLPTPGQPVERARRQRFPLNVNRPSRERQSARLVPRFAALQQAIESHRARFQLDAQVLVPEDVVVLETIGAVDRFVQAVERIPGMEWLAIILGSLATDEAREAIRENVAATAGDVLSDDCVGKFAAASHGFPQHIHAYVRGAVEAVRKLGHCGEGPSLEEALRRGDARRTDYYLDRLASMDMNDPIGAMAHLVAALDERDADAMLIDDAVAAFSGSKHDGRQVVEEAVARGVLARNRDGTVGFGIPSFQAFLLEKLRERDALFAARSPDRPLTE